MQNKIVTKGICSHCNGTFARATALKHAKKCAADNSKTHDSFIIKVQGPSHNPIYWLMIVVPFKSTLAALDQFLRKVWLECCGHLSQFKIGGVDFSSDEDDLFSMNSKIERVLSEGVKFKHRYDFGTTTDLLLSVVGVCKSSNKIELLMRNEEPVFSCAYCDVKASHVDPINCDFLCSECSEEDEEACILPLVNSPRTGLCSYTGSNEWI